MQASSMSRKYQNRMTFHVMFIIILFTMPSLLWGYSYSLNDGVLTITATDQNGEEIRVHVVQEATGKYVKINDDYVFLGVNSVHPDVITKIIVNGGPGNDTINLLGVKQEDFTNLLTGDYNCIVHGGDGDDRIEGCSEIWNKIYGDGGDDVIYGGDKTDWIDGGTDNDALFGGKGTDTLLGNDGDDEIYGGEAKDVVDGGSGEDILYGGDGSDTISGGEGNDILFGGEDNDWLEGGEGMDRLKGGNGTDEITGGAGQDYIDGGDGNDIIADGKDNDLIYDPKGEDTYKPTPGSADVFTDSAGVDTMSFAEAAMGITFDIDLQDVWQLVNADQDSLKIWGVYEHLVGSPFDDVFHIDPANVPRSVDGGGSTNGDVLHIDVQGLQYVDDGNSITVEGFEPITYSNFQAVEIENPSSVERNSIPDQFNLYQNHPNPFNPITTLSFDLPKRTDVKLSIFNITGQLIKRLVDGDLNPGSHTIQWDASNVPSGIYIYLIRTPDFSQVRKCVLMK